MCLRQSQLMILWSPLILPASHLRHRSLPVDFDIFFAAATGDCEHDANTDHNNDSDQGPCRTDAGQNTQFPKRGDNATNQDDRNQEDKYLSIS